MTYMNKWAKAKVERFSIEDGYFRKCGLTEADVAAEFAHRLKSLGGYNVHMEVRLPSTYHRSNCFRVDCLVTRTDDVGEKVIAAVEFKKPGKKVGVRTRQANAYDSLGIQWVYCVGADGIKAAIETIEQKARNN